MKKQEFRIYLLANMNPKNSKARTKTAKTYKVQTKNKKILKYGSIKERQKIIDFLNGQLNTYKARIRQITEEIIVVKNEDEDFK